MFLKNIEFIKCSQYKKNTPNKLVLRWPTLIDLDACKAKHGANLKRNANKFIGTLQEVQ